LLRIYAYHHLAYPTLVLQILSYTTVLSVSRNACVNGVFWHFYKTQSKFFIVNWTVKYRFFILCVRIFRLLLYFQRLYARPEWRSFQRENNKKKTLYTEVKDETSDDKKFLFYSNISLFYYTHTYNKTFVESVNVHKKVHCVLGLSCSFMT